ELFRAGTAHALSDPDAGCTKGACDQCLRRQRSVGARAKMGGLSGFEDRIRSMVSQRGAGAECSRRRYDLDLSPAGANENDRADSRVPEHAGDATRTGRPAHLPGNQFAPTHLRTVVVDLRTTGFRSVAMALGNNPDRALEAKTVSCHVCAH